MKRIHLVTILCIVFLFAACLSAGCSDESSGSAATPAATQTAPPTPTQTPVPTPVKTTVAPTTIATTIAKTASPTPTPTPAATVVVPSVLKTTPDTATINSTVNGVIISGNNFKSGATVALTSPGNTAINATNVVVNSATQITCTFAIGDVAHTAWNVVVTNPDGQSAILQNWFTITSAS